MVRSADFLSAPHSPVVLLQLVVPLGLNLLGWPLDIARITSFKVVISRGGDSLILEMMLSEVAAAPFRAPAMQISYTALHAWFLGSQVLAAGNGNMRNILYVFLVPLPSKSTTPHAPA